MTSGVINAIRTNREVCEALGLDPSNIQSVTIDLSRRPARVHISGLSVAITESQHALTSIDENADGYSVGVAVCEALGLDPSKVHGLKVVLSRAAPRFEMTNYIDSTMGADLAKVLATCRLTKVDLA